METLTVTVIVAAVLLMTVAEAVRGLLKWRSGGQKAAFLGLGGAIPCVGYLMRPHVSESFLLAFVLVGVTVAWGGYWVVARRSASDDSGSRQVPRGNKSGSKTLFLVLALLAADALAIVVIVTAIGHAALVIGSVLAINLVAVSLSGMFPASSSQ